MASIGQTILARGNPDASAAEGLSKGLDAGMKLATAKEQVESQKLKLEEQKAELVLKQASTANSLLTNLARANPNVAKQMLKGVRERLINLGVDPGVADYTISDDANRKRQIAFSQFAGGKLTSNPAAAQEYMQGLADLVGYDQAAQMFDQEFKRRQQDKQFAIQEQRMNRMEAKAGQQMNKDAEKASRQEAQALSKRLEADSIPEVVSSIKNIDQLTGGLYSNEAASKLDKIAGEKGFFASLKIPFTQIAPLEAASISSEDKPLYQAVAGLRNAYLKLRSGGAVTDPEADRFLQELGQGNIRSGKDLQNGLQILNESVANRVKTIESGFMPESVQLLAERGNPVSSANLPSGQKQIAKKMSLSDAVNAAMAKNPKADKNKLIEIFKAKGLTD